MPRLDPIIIDVQMTGLETFEEGIGGLRKGLDKLGRAIRFETAVKPGGELAPMFEKIGVSINNTGDFIDTFSNKSSLSFKQVDTGIENLLDTVFNDENSLYNVFDKFSTITVNGTGNIIDIKNSFDKLGNPIKDTNSNIISFNEVMRRVKEQPKGFAAQFDEGFKKIQSSILKTGKKMDWFRMEYLGVMFAGMQLQQSMSSLMRPAMNAEGVFEVWSDTMENLFQPAAEWAMNFVDSFSDSVDGLSDSMKTVINILAVGALGVGTYLFVMGQWTMAILSVKKAWASWIESGIESKQKKGNLTAQINGWTTSISNFGKETGKAKKAMSGFSLTGLIGKGIGLAVGAFSLASLFQIDPYEIMDNLTESLSEISDFLKDPENLEEFATDIAGLSINLVDELLSAFGLSGNIFSKTLNLLNPFKWDDMWKVTPEEEAINNEAWKKRTEMNRVNAKASFDSWIGDIDKYITDALTSADTSAQSSMDTMNINMQNKWDDIKKSLGPKLSSIYESIKNAFPTWESIGEIFTTITTEIGNAFDSIIRTLTNKVNDIIELYNKIPILSDLPKLTIGSGEVFGPPAPTTSPSLSYTGPMFEGIKYINGIETDIFKNFKIWVKENYGMPYPFAMGGIVTQPTYSLLGEAGPEAVIPLSKMGQMGGNTITYAPVYNFGAVKSEADKRNIVRMINDENHTFFIQNNMV